MKSTSMKQKSLLEQPCVDWFGNYGEGPRVVDVIENNGPLPEGISPATREFINACRHDPTVTHASSSLRDRYMAFKDSWRHCKEKTVSIHQHMGHYKAIMQDDYLSWLFF